MAVAREFGLTFGNRVTAVTIEADGAQTKLCTRVHFEDLVSDHAVSDVVRVHVFDIDISKLQQRQSEWLWNDFDAPEALADAARRNDAARQAFSGILQGW